MASDPKLPEGWPPLEEVLTVEWSTPEYIDELIRHHVSTCELPDPCPTLHALHIARFAVRADPALVALVERWRSEGCAAAKEETKR